MLKYNRIDLSEGTDVNKTSKFRKCTFCHYYYFLDINFNYQKYLCDGCHDMSLKANNMQNLAIVYRGKNVYRVNFAFMSKNDAFNLIKNSNIIDKKGVL